MLNIGRKHQGIIRSLDDEDEPETGTPDARTREHIPK
jgi:hypothetical protein